MERDFLTPRTIAELTGYSMPIVYGWIHSDDPERRLPSIRPGNSSRILIRRDDFDEWLRRHQVTQPNARLRRRRKVAAD